MTYRGESEFESWAKRIGEFYPKGSRQELEFRFSRMLVLTARRWTTFIDDAIKQRTGQSRTRWQTMSAILFSEGSVATTELAERMAVQWPTLIRTLNQLEADGLIERRINPRDKRSRLVSATEKGRHIFTQVKEVLDPKRAAILADFADEDLHKVEMVLGRFFAALVEESE